MAKLSDAFKSRYLKKSDFPRPQTCTIVCCEKENVAPPGDAPDEKYVLHFEEHDKGLTLNFGNSTFLMEKFGDDPDNLTGKRVEVYVDESVIFQKKRVGGIRLREAPVAKPVRKPAPKPEVADYDDSEPVDHFADMKDDNLYTLGEQG